MNVPPDLESIVLDAVDEHNEQAVEEERLVRSRDTVIFGEGGALDSMGLVNLILCVEQKVAEQTGREITLGDSRALSRKQSPFRTIGTLVEYVKESLDSNPS